MKVLKIGVMPDGTKIQIEEWHENYSFMPYASTIASYPISKWTHEGAFAPKAGERYRFDFSFKSQEETEVAFNALITGEKVLADYRENMGGKLEYRNCV